jgi:hypothetical protein
MEMCFENKMTAWRFIEIYFFLLALGLAAGTNSTGARHVINDTNI